MNPPDRVRFDQWPTYFVDLALMDGLGVLALLLVGIAVLCWRLSTTWSHADLLLAGSLLVPLALYSFYSTGEVRLRHFSLALPWVMLTAALGLNWPGRHCRAPAPPARSPLAVALLLVAAVPARRRAGLRALGMPARAGRPRRPASRRAPTAGAGLLRRRRAHQRPPARSLRQRASRSARRSPRKYPKLVVDMQARRVSWRAHRHATPAQRRGSSCPTATTPGIWPTCSSTTAAPGAAGTTCSPAGSPTRTLPANCACIRFTRPDDRPDAHHSAYRADRHGRARPAALRSAAARAQPPG